MSIEAPVIILALSETRKATTLATSSGFDNFLKGVMPMSFFSMAGVISVRVVTTVAGQMAFTLIL